MSQSSVCPVARSQKRQFLAVTMAQAGSAYNTHNRHQENHVKIGNWVEERALIETAPKMCVPVSSLEPGCPLSPSGWG